MCLRAICLSSKHYTVSLVFLYPEVARQPSFHTTLLTKKQVKKEMERFTTDLQLMTAKEMSCRTT